MILPYIEFITLLGLFSQNKWDYTPLQSPWGTTPPVGRIFFPKIFFLDSKKTFFLKPCTKGFIGRLGPIFFFEIFSGTFFSSPYTPLQPPWGTTLPPVGRFFSLKYFFRYEKNCFSETRPYGVYKRFEALKIFFRDFFGHFWGGLTFEIFSGTFFFSPYTPLQFPPGGLPPSVPPGGLHPPM